MRVRALLLTVLLLGALPASAAADYRHVVQPGETLTSVAAVDGLSIAAIATANGISPQAELVAGQILLIPPQTGATSAVMSTTTTTTVTQTVETATETSTRTENTYYAPASTPSSDSHATPQPTEERVSSGDIAEIAAENGVPASLAEAIAWQESGWNNDEVSGIGAVGVMQIVPSTWSWIDQYLTPAAPLGTASAAENVRAGVLLLHELLDATGDNDTMAIAGYYQGLASVKAYGMYSDTRQYVADVLSLAQRFGG